MVTSAETVTVEIPGGRQIEALVSGPPDGMGLVFHNGTPSGMAPIPPFADPGQWGLRTVQYARPGYLGSSPHPGRLQPAAQVGQLPYRLLAFPVPANHTIEDARQALWTRDHLRRGGVARVNREHD